MATSSIHIATGGSGYFSHNSRESKTVNAIFSDEKNYCSCTNAKAFETFKNELSIRTKAYIENNPTRKKLHSKTITHLSAIVNFNKEHTPADMRKVCKYLEKTFDTKVIQMAMHRDEGHISEDGEKVKNYHAHIEFMGLDSKGNSVRRKLDKKALITLQSEVAKLLNMERGKNYTELQEKRPKRLDTYEFKKAKEMEAEKVKDLLATKDQLKEANNQLRTFMKDNGANRADYAELEAEKKVLEEKLKAKTLTEKELLEKFQELEKSFLKEKGHLTSLIEVKDIDIIDLNNQNKRLEAVKIDLSSKVTALELKTAHSSNIAPSDVLTEFKKIQKEEITEKVVKVGVLKSEKIQILENPDSFIKKAWNLISNKYNQLLEEVKALRFENKAMKIEIAQLKDKAQTIVPKQQKESSDIFEKIQSEAKRNLEATFLVDKEKEITTTPKIRRDR